MHLFILVDIMSAKQLNLFTYNIWLCGGFITVAISQTQHLLDTYFFTVYISGHLGIIMCLAYDNEYCLNSA